MTNVQSNYAHFPDINNKATIVTYTGKSFNYIFPKAEDICIEDIAMGLSNARRFAGQLFNPMTVAQHSLQVCNLCPPELKLVGLLHDASEAYTGDCPKPLKRFLPQFQQIENEIMEVIFEKYNLNIKDLVKIKLYDKQAFIYEKRNAGDVFIPVLTSEQAYNTFLITFIKLINANE